MKEYHLTKEEVKEFISTYITNGNRDNEDISIIKRTYEIGESYYDGITRNITMPLWIKTNIDIGVKLEKYHIGFYAATESCCTDEYIIEQFQDYFSCFVKNNNKIISIVDMLSIYEIVGLRDDGLAYIMIIDVVVVPS